MKNYSFFIGLKKYLLYKQVICLAYLSVLIISSSCVYDSKVADDIQLEIASWNIEESYPNHDERAKAIGLEYTKKDIQNALIKALELSAEQASILFNADGTVNMSKLKEFVAKGLIPIKVSYAFATEMKALAASEEYQRTNALFSLLSAYKNNLRTAYSLEEEIKILDEGLKEIAEVSAKAKGWEKRITEIKNTVHLDNFGQTDISRLVSSEITLLPYDMNLEVHKFGTMFTIVNHPIVLDTANISAETLSARFTFEEYKGSNKDLMLVYSLNMVHKFLKEIQDKASSLDYAYLRSSPHLNNPLRPWFTNRISDRCFPYILDGLVKQWIDAGLTQNDIAYNLKRVNTTDIVFV